MADLNREVLINHLFDLRALEIAKTKLIKTINDNNNQIKKLGYTQYYANPSYIIPFVIPLFVAAFLGVIAYILSKTVFLHDLFSRQLNPKYEDFLVAPVSDMWYIYVPEEEKLKTYIMVWLIIILIIAIIVFVILLSYTISKKKEFKRLVKENDERLTKEKRLATKLKTENDLSTAKLKEVNELLAKSYSINIIPQQFRTVQGVCYLYDYMSTSQQSLESAFLNYNVNSFANKVIENQSEMILQQYITNAKLELMEGHNKRMIAQLNSIEQNTANAAKYAQISAANTDTIAFFEGYKFLKDK